MKKLKSSNTKGQGEKMKKIIIAIISISLIGLFVLKIKDTTKYTEYRPSEYGESLLSLNAGDGTYTFNSFLEDNERKIKPNVEVFADLTTFEFVDGLFENDNPYFDTFTDNLGESKEGIYIPETGDISFDVIVEEPGLYNMHLTYYTVEGRSAAVNRGVKVNNKFQYIELENIVINRTFEDEFKVSERRVAGKDDLRPKQIEKHLWGTIDVQESMGQYQVPFYFDLKAGKNKITFTSNREPIVLNEIKFYQAKEAQSYEAYIQSYESLGAKKVTSDFNYVLQAEESLHKSSPTLNPVAEFTTSKYYPYEKYITRYNAIGGVNWRVPGEEITWEVEVPEAGLYLVSLKIMQNFNRGKHTTRSFKVNGKTPFKEANLLEFKYSSDLQYVTIGDKDGFYVYFNEGKNTISLQTTIGVYGDIVSRVNVLIKEMRTLYREIVMRTGINPDPVQDYMLERNIENLNERLEDMKETLETIKDEIIGISGSRSELVSVYDRTLYQLEKFLKYEKNIQKGLKEFEQNISSLGSWVIQISEQPLIIDEITVHGSGYKLPKVKTGFFAKLWHELILFFGSFKDVGDFGSTELVDGPTIEVWTGTGRDQATILRQLIDESFVKQHNINVQLKMVNMGILLSASLSGNGPDVAINIDQKTPVNWGIRNAILDVSQFDDFEEVSSWFSESAMLPLSFENKTYGLPNTEDFLVLFYRQDILEELGVKEEPKTWEEVRYVSNLLQTKYLDFYIPVVQGTLNGTLYAMIEQAGGRLYLNGGREIGILEPESMKAFEEFTNFFTVNGFVLEADFLNRFRSGEMPIGIQNFTLYNMLSVFAPEIQGQWNYALLPGTAQEDGSIDHSTTSVISASVIMNHTKQKDESWEFLKWWHSEEVQLDYARSMEAILGSAARYPTANLQAFAKLPWPAKDYALLEQQRAYAKGIPTVPGDYIVGRHIDNAFRLAINKQILLQDSVYQYHLVINEEIARKRKELGLD